MSLDRWTTVPGALNLAWSPNGDTIAVATFRGVSLLDGAALAEIASNTTQNYQYALAYADDGTRLASADGWEAGQTTTVWDAVNLNRLEEYRIPGSDADHLAPVMQLGLSAPGRIVLAVSEVGLGVWTTTAGGPMRRIFRVEGAEPITTALDLSNHLLGVSVGPAESVQVWDTAEGKMLQEAPLSGASDLAFTHAGTSLVALLDFYAMLWDLDKEVPSLRIPISDPTLSGPRIPYDVAISRDDHILASGTEIPSPGIGLWDLGSGELLALLEHEALERVTRLAFSPVADELAVLLNDGRLEVWSVQN